MLTPAVEHTFIHIARRKFLSLGGGRAIKRSAAKKLKSLVYTTDGALDIAIAWS